jgi:lipoprotein-anchoring transpeptidase ErfK/SrfK
VPEKQGILAHDESISGGGFFLAGGGSVWSIPCTRRGCGACSDEELAALQNRRSDKSPIPRQIVRYAGEEAENTIIINTMERRLYYTLGNGRAIKYGVGVGRDGFTWAGTDSVSGKAEWPGWTPPKVMIRREAKKGRILPAYMPGGPDNPLGARAMYTGSTIYRNHGTNQPWTIGQAISSECIRMANDDVKHLYEQVSIGTKVVVIR